MNTDEPLLTSLIDTLTGRGVCFALYRLPWQEELHLVWQEDAVPYIIIPEADRRTSRPTAGHATNGRSVSSMTHCTAGRCASSSSPVSRRGSSRRASPSDGRSWTPANAIRG